MDRRLYRFTTPVSQQKSTTNTAKISKVLCVRVPALEDQDSDNDLLRLMFCCSAFRQIGFSQKAYNSPGRDMTYGTIFCLWMG
jgi:hypothetical protein